LLTPADYDQHLRDVLLSPEDLGLMDALMQESDWIESRPVKS
jgi:hypothetical protein